MSSRDALLSALAAVAFGAAGATATTAMAKTDPAAVCTEIRSATNAADVRRHLGDVDCGAPAVARLLELQGLPQVAQAGGSMDTPLCLYRPDDPWYRLDPRCPPTSFTPSSSGGSSSSTGGYAG